MPNIIEQLTQMLQQPQAQAQPQTNAPVSTPQPQGFDLQGLINQINAQKQTQIQKLGGANSFDPQHPIVSGLRQGVNFLGNLAGGFNEREYGRTDPRLAQIRQLQDPNFTPNQAMGQMQLQNEAAKFGNAPFERARMQAETGRYGAETDLSKAQTAAIPVDQDIQRQRIGVTRDIGMARASAAQTSSNAAMMRALMSGDNKKFEDWKDMDARYQSERDRINSATMPDADKANALSEIDATYSAIFAALNATATTPPGASSPGDAPTPRTTPPAGKKADPLGIR